MAPRKKTKLSNNNNCGVDALRKGALSKTRKNTCRARRGCLEIVQTLPLDVSFEIFALLHPRDLLNLAKTSKAFRSFFLSRANSISIWKAALRQVDDLPEKPEFLSEPMFAHLLFSPFCQKCGKSGIQNPMWKWFVRYCSACIHNWDVQKSNCYKYPDPDRQLELAVKEHGLTIANIYWIPTKGGEEFIRSPQLDSFVKRWQDEDGDEDWRKALVEEVRVATKERAATVKRLEAWHAAEKGQRSAELENLRQRRLEEILVRLRADEWLAEMDYFGDDYVVGRLARFPIVHYATLLTNRVWPKVRAAIQGEMNAIRARRLQEERKEQIEGRLHELSEAILEHCVQLPRTASMDCRPTLRILLREEECCRLVIAPTDQEVTRRDFAEILPEVCARWRAACAEELRGLVRGAMPAIAEGVDPLDLAVAVFKCEGCDNCRNGGVARRYPELLAHDCMGKYSRDNAKGEEEVRVRWAVAGLLEAADTKSAMAQAAKNAQPRTKIRVNRGLSEAYEGVVCMRYIVAALGLDPTRARREDLEKCDARLRCRVCSPETREVFTWEGAYWHWHTRSGVDRDFWERVCEEDMPTVRELEAKAGTLSREKARWGCTLCREWDGRGSEMERHLREKHQLDDFGACVEDGTVYLHLSQCDRSNPVTVRLPKSPEGSECPAAGAPALAAV